MNEFWVILVIVALVGIGASLFLDKVFNPWISSKWIKKKLRKIESGEIKPRRFDISIVGDSGGFFFQQDKTQDKSPRLAWANVAKATAYKRDLWSTDCICISFETTDGKAIEAHEEMNGWNKFIEALPMYLPGCKPSSEWIWNVSTPAFAPKVTEIFARSQSPPSAEGTAC